MGDYGLAVREGFRNFHRARTLSLALIGCIAVAVFAIGAFGLLTLNVNALLNKWESRVELVAFLSYDLGEQEAEDVLEQIARNPLVGEARLVTGRRSWEKFFGEAGVTMDLGEIPIEEVLPPSIVIRPASGGREVGMMRRVAAHITSLDGVDEVNFEEVLLERYMQLRRDLAAVTTGTSIFLLLVFGIITANIARLASAARRNEVSTLSTLGASGKFVRRVFMIEGIAQGLAGSAVGIAVLLAAALVLSRRIGGDIVLPPRLFAALFVVGPVLGLLSSWFLLRNVLTIAFAVLLAIVPGAAAQASESLESEIVRRRNELNTLEEELKESRATVEKISNRELAAIDEVEELDKELESISHRIEMAERNVASNRAAAGAAKTELGRREIELSRSRKELGQWLRLLCNQREPTMVEVILNDIPHSEITRRREMIERLTRKQAEALEQTELLYREFVGRQEELKKRSELDVLYTETVRLQARQAAEKKRQREALLARLREQKNIYAAVINDLEVSSQRLQRLVETEGESEREGFIGSVPFRDMKGLLPWPVDGEITAHYGRMKAPDSSTYTRHRGLDFGSPAGSEIRAVHDASVVYCDWFRGYGKLVILDHGGGYNSVYAHCSDILVQKGDTVRAGRPIALVGETGSLKGPFLYFEIREKGHPVDPAFWLQRRNIDATRSK